MLSKRSGVTIVRPCHARESGQDGAKMRRETRVPKKPAWMTSSVRVPQGDPAALLSHALHGFTALTKGESHRDLHKHRDMRSS